MRTVDLQGEFWPAEQDLAAHGFDNAVYGLDNLSLPRDQYQPPVQPGPSGKPNGTFESTCNKG